MTNAGMSQRGRKRSFMVPPVSPHSQPPRRPYAEGDDGSRCEALLEERVVVRVRRGAAAENAKLARPVVLELMPRACGNEHGVAGTHVRRLAVDLHPALPLQHEVDLLGRRGGSDARSPAPPRASPPRGSAPPCGAAHGSSSRPSSRTPRRPRPTSASSEHRRKRLGDALLRIALERGEERERERARAGVLRHRAQALARSRSARACTAADGSTADSGCSRSPRARSARSRARAPRCREASRRRRTTTACGRRRRRTGSRRRRCRRATRRSASRQPRAARGSASSFSSWPIPSAALMSSIR